MIWKREVMKMNCSENDKIFEKLLNHEISIAVVGIGYVSYPLVQLLSQKFKVIAYDIDPTLTVKIVKFK